MSDNGTNFTGADWEIRELFKFLKSTEHRHVVDHCSLNGNLASGNQMSEVPSKTGHRRNQAHIRRIHDDTCASGSLPE